MNTNQTLLAARYASALRAAIAEPARLEEAAASLNRLAAIFNTNDDCRHVLINPVLDKRARRQLLETVMAAENVGTEVQRTIQVLLDNNRVNLLPAIASQFENKIDDWLNRVEVTVVTAVPLTPDLEGRLLKSLQHFTGKTVRLISKVFMKQLRMAIHLRPTH